MRPHRGAHIIAGLAALVLMTANVRAAERITLSNGFMLTCSHHAEVQGKVRVYTAPGTESYMELAPEEIAGIETVPDPPSTTIPKRAAAPETANETAKLTSEDLGQILASAGVTHNVDVDLLASVVKAESGGNPHARSRAGAQGLMQLMPGTAAELGVQDSYRPEQNVSGGSQYLDALLTRYHDNLALALAAYNAGPAAVDKYRGIPPYRETRLYVARVIHEFNRRVMARQAMALQGIAKSATASR